MRACSRLIGEPYQAMDLKQNTELKRWHGQWFWTAVHNMGRRCSSCAVYVQLLFTTRKGCRTLNFCVSVYSFRASSDVRFLAELVIEAVHEAVFGANSKILGLYLWVGCLALRGGCCHKFGWPKGTLSLLGCSCLGAEPHDIRPPQVRA